MDRKITKNVPALLLVAFCWLFPAKEALAVNTPSFPSCVNPTGKLIVSYSTGIHGVPGRTVSYSGADSVYLLDDGNTLQCLCTVNGDGLQTNWWKVSSLTEEELNRLKAEEWFLVPDGSLWGLEKTTYMARNLDYACRTSGGGSSSSSSSSNDSSGQVQGTSTRFGQVLGLATTGTLPVIATYLSLGVVLLLASRLLKK